jgi:hypothetical protein
MWQGAAPCILLLGMGRVTEICHGEPERPIVWRISSRLMCSYNSFSVRHTAVCTAWFSDRPPEIRRQWLQHHITEINRSPIVVAAFEPQFHKIDRQVLRANHVLGVASEFHTADLAIEEDLTVHVVKRGVQAYDEDHGVGSHAPHPAIHAPHKAAPAGLVGLARSETTPQLLFSPGFAFVDPWQDEMVRLLYRAAKLSPEGLLRTAFLATDKLVKRLPICLGGWGESKVCFYLCMARSAVTGRTAATSRRACATSDPPGSPHARSNKSSQHGEKKS